MLHLNNVSGGYGKSEIIRGVSFEVQSGETFSLIGPNGSGKSTLLKIVLGLTPAYRGQIQLAGKDIHSFKSTERSRKISLLEAVNYVNFDITLDELIDLSIKNNSHAKKVKDLALTGLGITEFLGRSLLQLSTGQLKRAFLAHGLCTNSEVILLDEPFANLDWNQQRALADLLREWKREFGTTFVLAVHEFQWALNTSSRLCLLNEGVAVEVGPAEEVLQSKKTQNIFGFRSIIDKNPLDQSSRITLA